MLLYECVCKESKLPSAAERACARASCCFLLTNGPGGAPKQVQSRAADCVRTPGHFAPQPPRIGVNLHSTAQASSPRRVQTTRPIRGRTCAALRTPLCAQTHIGLHWRLHSPLAPGAPAGRLLHTRPLSLGLVWSSLFVARYWPSARLELPIQSPRIGSSQVMRAERGETCRFAPSSSSSSCPMCVWGPVTCWLWRSSWADSLLGLAPVGGAARGERSARQWRRVKCSGRRGVVVVATARPLVARLGSAQLAELLTPLVCPSAPD